jgi:hypothetical protein
VQNNNSIYVRCGNAILQNIFVQLWLFRQICRTADLKKIQ